MNSHHHGARGLAAAVLAAALLSTPTAAQPPRPGETRIELTGGAVAVGVGYTWGRGVLIYQGLKHNLKISGLSVVDIGASRYSASGPVRNLHRLSDINGVYKSAELGAAVAAGGSVISMKNDKGVVINLSTTRRGLQFTAAPKGVTIRLVN